MWALEVTAEGWASIFHISNRCIRRVSANAKTVVSHPERHVQLVCQLHLILQKERGAGKTRVIRICPHVRGPESSVSRQIRPVTSNRIIGRLEAIREYLMGSQSGSDLHSDVPAEHFVVEPALI